MKTSKLWALIRSVQDELRAGNLETQDTAICALHEYLNTSESRLLPSFAYPLLQNILHFYCQDVLPDGGMSSDDQQFVRNAFEQTINRLDEQEQHAKTLGSDCKDFFLQVKSGDLQALEEVLAVLVAIITTSRLSERAQVCVPDTMLMKQFQTLKKSPFTTKHVVPFFEALIAGLSNELQQCFGSIHDLFWHQLNELLQIKAVLVNTKTRVPIIMRLDITMSLAAHGLDTLGFENTVDDRMYQSCWNALQAVRSFLEAHFPDILKDQSLQVMCRFPNPVAGYNDTSISLLVGLKVIGDVLDMEIDSHALVTGEVDNSGKILPVACLSEKIRAAEQHPDIHRLYLPSDGLLVENSSVIMCRVRTFSDAVRDYYGEPLQKKLRYMNRRNVLKGALGLTAAPFVPVMFSAVKNLFISRVSEHDWRLFACAEELYQKKSDYRSAITIFQSILDRFQRGSSSTEVIRIQALTLGHLGRIYVQQCDLDKGLDAYRQAFDLWKAIHERERQVDILLYIGIAYAEIEAEQGYSPRRILHYYGQAETILHPAMKTFGRLKGNIALWRGALYHALNEPERAKTFAETGGSCFQDHGALWNYQIARQHVGKIFISLGKYDEALEIFHRAFTLPILQNPFNQALILTGLCDTYCSMGNTEEGWQYAQHAQRLCEESGLQLQMLALRRVFVKHQGTFSELPV